VTLELTKKIVLKTKESSNSPKTRIEFKETVKLVNDELENNLKQNLTTPWSKKLMTPSMLKESSHSFLKPKSIDQITIHVKNSNLKHAILLKLYLDNSNTNIA